MFTIYLYVLWQTHVGFRSVLVDVCEIWNILTTKGNGVLNDILLVRQRTTRISFFNILFFSNDGALNVWKKPTVFESYMSETHIRI